MTNGVEEFQALMSELPRFLEGNVRKEPETNEWTVTLGSVELIVAYREATGRVLTIADVAPFGSTLDDERRARALLAMNWQWRGSDGFTISVDPQAVRLTVADNRRADRIASPSAMGAYLGRAAMLVQELRDALEEFEADVENIAAGNSTEEA